MLTKKRVAVCISGELHGWKFAAENIKNYFKHPNISVDYFAHIWDTNEIKMNTKCTKNIVHGEDKEFINTYKPILYYVSHTNDYNISSWDKLFYSFEYVITLKTQHELKNNFIYDIVIKISPNLIFNNKTHFPFFEHHLKKTCYTSQPLFSSRYVFGIPCFNEQIFFGDSRTMDIVSGLFKYFRSDVSTDKTHENILDIDVNRFLTPPTMLYKYLIIHNIYPMMYDIKYLTIPKDMPDYEFDFINGFEKIKKYITRLQENTQ